MAYSFAVYTPYKRNKLSTYPVFGAARTNSEVNSNKYNIFASLVGKHLMKFWQQVEKFVIVMPAEKEMINNALEQLPKLHISETDNLISKVNQIAKKFANEINLAVNKSIKYINRRPALHCEISVENMNLLDYDLNLLAA